MRGTRIPGESIQRSQFDVGVVHGQAGQAERGRFGRLRSVRQRRDAQAAVLERGLDAQRCEVGLQSFQVDACCLEGQIDLGSGRRELQRAVYRGPLHDPWEAGCALDGRRRGVRGRRCEGAGGQRLEVGLQHRGLGPSVVVEREPSLLEANAFHAPVEGRVRGERRSRQRTGIDDGSLRFLLDRNGSTAPCDPREREVAVTHANRIPAQAPRQDLTHVRALRPSLFDRDRQLIQGEGLVSIVRELGVAQFQVAPDALARLIGRFGTQGQFHPAVDTLRCHIEAEGPQEVRDGTEAQVRQLELEREVGRASLGRARSLHAEEVQQLRRGRDHVDARAGNRLPLGVARHLADVGGADGHRQGRVESGSDQLVVQANRDVLGAGRDDLDRRFERQAVRLVRIGRGDVRFRVDGGGEARQHRIEVPRAFRIATEFHLGAIELDATGAHVAGQERRRVHVEGQCLNLHPRLRRTVLGAHVRAQVPELHAPFQQFEVEPLVLEFDAVARRDRAQDRSSRETQSDPADDGQSQEPHETPCPAPFAHGLCRFDLGARFRLLGTHRPSAPFEDPACGDRSVGPASVANTC